MAMKVLTQKTPNYSYSGVFKYYQFYYRIFRCFSFYRIIVCAYVLLLWGIGAGKKRWVQRIAEKYENHMYNARINSYI